MSESVVEIPLGRLHCADCLATLSDVVLPKMPGVVRTETAEAGLLVTLDDRVISAATLVERLTEAGLLR